jgi:hypothetical protein
MRETPSFSINLGKNRRKREKPSKKVLKRGL